MAVNDGRVVSNFIIQALKNEPITIFGDGLQTRSFCYVEDMVGGLISLMEGEDIGPINLGTTIELTIMQLAEKIIQLSNSKSEIKNQDLPQDDPIRRKPDLSFAESSINWEPKVGIEEGLKKTIEYFSSCLVKRQ
tara:strand:- start:32 stop:436 length:405 start_codon:yes stop_codon:yes gene_type:complete